MTVTHLNSALAGRVYLDTWTLEPSKKKYGPEACTKVVPMTDKDVHAYYRMG